MCAGSEEKAGMGVSKSVGVVMVADEDVVDGGRAVLNGMLECDDSLSTAYLTFPGISRGVIAIPYAAQILVENSIAIAQKIR